MTYGRLRHFVLSISISVSGTRQYIANLKASLPPNYALNYDLGVATPSMKGEGLVTLACQTCVQLPLYVQH